MNKVRLEEIVKAYGCEVRPTPQRDTRDQVTIMRTCMAHEVSCEVGTYWDLLRMSEEDLERQVKDSANYLGHWLVELTNLRIKEVEPPVEQATPPTGIRSISPRPAPVENPIGFEVWEGGDGA